MPIKCPKCQTENSESAKFSISCGQPLQIDLVCPKCHHTNKAIAKFCEECGQLLTPAQSTIAVPTTQPTSLANGRYQVKKYLGEGGKKKVYSAETT